MVFPRHVFINSYPHPAVEALDQRVSLDCYADGLPRVSYDWKLNGHDLKRGNQWSNRLTIANPKVKDVGNYSCVARNILGSRESKPVVVNVECK